MMLNMNKPTHQIAAAILAIIVFLILIYAYQTFISSNMMVTAIGVLLIVALILYSMKSQRKEKEIFEEAFIFLEDHVQKIFRASILKDSLYYMTGYDKKGDEDPSYFGFTFIRSGSGQTNKPMNAVLKRKGSSFNIIHLEEEPSGEKENNPFQDFTYIIKGSSQDVPEKEEKKKDKDSVTVNVGKSEVDKEIERMKGKPDDHK